MANMVKVNLVVYIIAVCLGTYTVSPNNELIKKALTTC